MDTEGVEVIVGVTDGEAAGVFDGVDVIVGVFVGVKLGVIVGVTDADNVGV